MSYALQHQVDSLRARMWGVEQRLTPTPGDLAALDKAQSRADSVANYFGEKASAPVPGETPLAYRRRQLDTLRQHSPKFKDKAFANAPADALEMIEEQVYADAIAAAIDPRNIPAGTLRAVSERDAAGRLVTRYFGDNAAWMAPMMAGGQVGTVNRPLAEKAR
jgi:hypothetical protein